MTEARAYAVAVAEVRGLAGAAPADRVRLRALARATDEGPPLRRRDLLGPIHRRVPGAPVVPDDEPTSDDLERLLDGAPAAADRVTATWRLLERLVAGLAHASVPVPAGRVPEGLLAPVGVALPENGGHGLGWCSRGEAAVVEPLGLWLAGFDGPDGWTATAAREGRAAPEVVVFSGPT